MHTDNSVRDGDTSQCTSNSVSTKLNYYLKKKVILTESVAAGLIFFYRI